MTHSSHSDQSSHSLFTNAGPPLEEWLVEACRGLPGATLEWKPEWDAWTFLVGRKLFGLWGEDGTGVEILSVKGPPEENEDLRQKYRGLVPGYHLNKRHWNSLVLEGPTADVPKEFMVELLIQSHDLVVSGLTKWQQAEIRGNTP